MAVIQIEKPTPLTDPDRRKKLRGRGQNIALLLGGLTFAVIGAPLTVPALLTAVGISAAVGAVGGFTFHTLEKNIRNRNIAKQEKKDGSIITDQYAAAKSDVKSVLDGFAKEASKVGAHRNLDKIKGKLFDTFDDVRINKRRLGFKSDKLDNHQKHFLAAFTSSSGTRTTGGSFTFAGGSVDKNDINDDMFTNQRYARKAGLKAYKLNEQNIQTLHKCIDRVSTVLKHRDDKAYAAGDKLTYNTKNTTDQQREIMAGALYIFTKIQEEEATKGAPLTQKELSKVFRDSGKELEDMKLDYDTTTGEFKGITPPTP